MELDRNDYRQDAGSTRKMFRPSNREFGQQGFSQPGKMTSMQRLDAVQDVQNDRRREGELYRRLDRQLGRISRKGGERGIEAGIDLLGVREKASEAGYKPYGISRFEDNRSTAAQSLKDRSNNIADQDAATNGGDASQSGGRFGYQGQGGGAGDMDGNIDYGEDTAGGSLYSGEAVGSADVAGAAPPKQGKFGYQGGAQSRLDAPSPSPIANRAPESAIKEAGPASGVEGAVSGPSRLDAIKLPAEPTERKPITYSRPRNSEDLKAAWQRGDALQKEGVTNESLTQDRSNIEGDDAYRKGEYKSFFDQRDRRMDDLKTKRRDDQIDSELRFDKMRNERQTSNFRGEARPVPGDSGLTYASRDSGGNQYRPRDWTQEKEDAAAEAVGLYGTANRASSFVERLSIGDQRGPKLGFVNAPSRVAKDILERVKLNQLSKLSKLDQPRR